MRFSLFLLGERRERRELFGNVEVIRWHPDLPACPSLFVIGGVRRVIGGHVDLERNLAVHHFAHLLAMGFDLQMGPLEHLPHVVVVA